MRKAILILIILTLTGCERGSFMSYHANSVFIDKNEITILFQIKKIKYKAYTFSQHGSGKQWDEWSRLYMAKYNFNIHTELEDKKLAPNTVDKILDIKGEIKPYQYLISNNEIFDKMGVRSKNRKHVYIPSEKGIYDTHTRELIINLNKNLKYSKFKNLLNSKYYYHYKKMNKESNVPTHYSLMSDGKLIVSFPSETSSYEFIDFNTINIFDIEGSSIGTFRFNTPEDYSEGFRIIDVEYLKNQWICLFRYYDEDGLNTAIWNSEGNILNLPFSFYSKGDYDIWNINENYFAKLSSFDSEYNGKEYELKVYKYDSSEPIVLKLNTEIVDNINN